MKLIPIIQKINRIKRDISETQTIISTILPILKYLGWDVFNENRVIFEDVTTTKKRVDITLVFENGSKFIIEAKRLSHKLSIKDFEQLTLYLNSSESINFGILTNGIDYWIADNKRDGLENKKIYSFNIFELTECDLSILKLFFSFSPSYGLKDLHRYIEYIQMGIDFGDKKCEKILNISNFEADIEIQPKSSKELISETNFKKPQFETKQPKFEEFLEEKREEEEKKKEKEKIEKPKKEIERPKEEEEEEIEVEILEPKEGEEKKIFEILQTNRAKIYLLGEYHILTDRAFPPLFVKMLKYILQKVKDYPALYKKIISKFEFIVDEETKKKMEGDFRAIGDGLYYNVDVRGYVMVENIEELLTYIQNSLE